MSIDNLKVFFDLCFSDLAVLFEVTDKDCTNTRGWTSWQKLKIKRNPDAPLLDVFVTQQGVAPQLCTSESEQSRGVFSAWEADAICKTRDNILTFHTLTHWSLKTLPQLPPPQWVEAHVLYMCRSDGHVVLL